MKTLLYALFVFGLMAGVFVAGRWSAPAPSYQPVVDTASEPLGAAFEELVRAQQETVALYQSSEFFGSEQARAEAYRGFLYSLVGSIKTGALMSPDFPRFMRAVDWTSKRGLDNPDNNYYTAILDDSASYRIRGNRGTTSDLVFQLLIGVPGVRGAGSSTNVSVLNGPDLLVDEAGNFEIIVSRSDPGSAVNWLPSTAGAKTLLVRYTHSNWSEETDHPLLIEKIGGEGDHTAPLTEEVMAKALREVAINLYDSTATWLQFAERAWQLMPRNAVSAARPSEGGLVGQYSAFGTWELEADQALIISTAPSDARYQGIELGNLWFVSLDYESRTSSLTLDQMHCSSDGRCHAVVAHRDPGVQNWLDTGGHRQGLIMLRWQGLADDLPEEQQPSAQLIRFDAIKQSLPPDVPAFSATDRLAQIRARRAAVQLRFGG